MELLILAIYWILYFILHSLLAGTWLKGVVKNNTPKFYPFYRLLYNTIALVTLFLVLKYQQSITPMYYFEKALLLQIVGYAVSIIGAALGYLAFKNYSTSEFLGLDFNKHLQENSNTLNTSGFNSLVRHPLYFASLILIWGYFLANPISTVLIMNGVITAYLIIGTKFEEYKLIKEFGKQYRDYISRIPMLIPNISKLIKLLLSR